MRGSWDADRLEQVFSNVVGNAIQYGASEGVVRVSARSEGTMVCIEVHNDGLPMTSEPVASVFDPFRRGDRESRTKPTAGLGVGVFISREIVVAHGGTLEVRSKRLPASSMCVSSSSTC